MFEVGSDGGIRLRRETRFWRVAWSGGFSALLRWSRNAHPHIFRGGEGQVTKSIENGQ